MDTASGLTLVQLDELLDEFAQACAESGRGAEIYRRAERKKAELRARIRKVLAHSQHSVSLDYLSDTVAREPLNNSSTPELK